MPGKNQRSNHNMSRFFATNYNYDETSSSSEEDLLSSSEELLSSSEEGELSDDSLFNDESESESDFDSDDSDAKPYGPDWFKKPEFRKGGNKFLKGASYSDSDESDEEDGKKVVKSAREKLLDEMQAVYDKIETAEMSDDWMTILNEFDSITRLLVRAQQQNFGIPKIFVKVVAQVEDLVSNSEQTEIKNKAVSKAFNTTKQRVKKIARENEALLAKFREDPQSFDKEDTVEPELPPLNEENKVFTGKGVNLSSLASASSEFSFMASLQIVNDSRGKKNSNQAELIKTLEELLNIAKTPYERILAYLTLIPTRLEESTNLSYQPIDQWKSTHDDLNKLFDILDENISSYQVTELAARNDDLETEPEPNANGIREILGSLLSFTERLDDEFKKSLLNIDPHSSDYLERLRDEQNMYNLLLRTQLYMEATIPEERQEQLLARAFVRRLDHIYYKSNKLISIIENSAWKAVPSSYKSKHIPLSGNADEEYCSQLVEGLSKSLANQDNVFLQKRATLSHIYYTALNGEFEVAKELLLKTKVQSNINKSDPSLQILFNRVVVQLGLSAFKLCKIEECHQILNELLASSHLREILGQQSLQRIASNSSSSSSSEDREKQCLPYHQHINLDLVDLVFMTSSLLIEIPQMTAYLTGIKTKKVPVYQKSVRRLVESFDKSFFHGPPESIKEHVLYAAKSMQKGDWKGCLEYLKSVKTWNLLPNSVEVLDNLTERIQIETMKTYVFTYRRFYEKISIKKFSELFSLPEDKIVTTMEKVIADLELNIKLDDNKTYIVIEKGDEVSKLEEVAVKLNKEIRATRERLNPSHHNHR